MEDQDFRGGNDWEQNRTVARGRASRTTELLVGVQNRVKDILDVGNSRTSDGGPKHDTRDRKQNAAHGSPL
jgi:hypothetical protein